MRLVAVRLAKELLIEFDDLRVVVRLTQCLSLILRVECLSSLLLVCIHDVIRLIVQEALSYIRLTTAVDTTARAAHDLDELILGLAFTDLVEENLSALHAGSDSNVNCCAVDIERSLSDACIVATNCLELDRLGFLACELEVNSSELCNRP